jgi:hypothetical protein
MRQLLNIFLVITTFTLGAQNKTHEKLSLNFEYSKHQYAMDSLNKHYLDYYIKELEFLDDKIKFGYNVSFGINYRPSSKFDFGIRIGYQYASTQKTIQTEIYGISPQPIETDMLNLVKVNSTNICLSSSFYLSSLIDFFERNNILNRLGIALEGSLGIGFNQSVAYVHYSNPEIPYSYSFNFAETSNRALFSQLGCKSEFRTTNNPILTAIGFKFGYQFFRTGLLKFKSSEEVYLPINLDFSGFYYGIYLKLGK